MDYQIFGLVEKPAIVLDIGDAYTRCGFAGEVSPRFSVKTAGLLRTVKGKTLVLQRPPLSQVDGNRSVGVRNSLKAWTEAFLLFFNPIFFRYLQTNSNERRVVVCDSLLTPSLARQALARVLFMHYKVPSILFAPSPASSLIALQQHTALIVDVGYSQARVLPVVEGTCVTKAFQAVPLGARAMHNNLIALLRREGVTVEVVGGAGSDSSGVDVGASTTSVEDVSTDLLGWEVLEDICSRLCFVDGDPDDNAVETPDVPYTFEWHGHACSLTLPGRLRGRVTDVLFNGRLPQGRIEVEGGGGSTDAVGEDADCGSVPLAFLEALLMAEVDSRVELVRKVLLVGGVTCMHGFAHRLLTEVRRTVELVERFVCLKALMNEMDFVSNPHPPHVLPWLGASAYGFLETKQCIERDTFMEYHEKRVEEGRNEEDSKKDADETKVTAEDEAATETEQKADGHVGDEVVVVAEASVDCDEWGEVHEFPLPDWTRLVTQGGTDGGSSSSKGR